MIIKLKRRVKNDEVWLKYRRNQSYDSRGFNLNPRITVFTYHALR